MRKGKFVMAILHWKQGLLYDKIVSPFVHNFDIISLFAAELEKPKIGISGKRLTAYQTIPCFDNSEKDGFW